MTLGLSPKIVPAILTAVAGLVVTIIGALNGDDGTLYVGVSLLAGGGASAAAGAALPPGEVLVEQGPASDDLLDLERIDEEAETPSA